MRWNRSAILSTKEKTQVGMSASADVIVVGLGAMGSASAYHLAKRGCEVLAFDQFKPLHDRGSSHGQTRVIREAYFEDPTYVPLIQRAYQLWKELSKEAGQELLLQTGGLMIGPPESGIVRGARLSAQQHSLPYEELSAAEVTRRFPVLQPATNMVAIWEPRAGVLALEKCVQAHLNLAKELGATLRFEETVLSWAVDGSGVQIETTRGQYRAAKLLFTAGSWVGTLCPDLPIGLRIERPSSFWFESSSGFHPDACPIHIWEHQPNRFFYGLPDLGRGVKLAQHHGAPVGDPNHVSHQIDTEEIAAMENIVRSYLPGLKLPHVDSSVCLYTNTPDHHFFLDHLPGHPQIWVASPCSGHGFKFSCVIGEIMTQLILNQRCELDISLFRRRSVPSSHHAA